MARSARALGPPAPSRTSQPRARSSSRSRSASAKSRAARAAARRSASSTTSAGAPSSRSSRLSSPSTPSISRRCAVADRAVRAVGLADPLGHRGQRARRVVVVGERVEERVAVRRQRLRRVARREPAARVADPLDPPRGVLELLARERQRLAVVPLGRRTRRACRGRPRRAPRRARGCCRPTSPSSRSQLQHPVVHPDLRERRARAPPASAPPRSRGAGRSGRCRRRGSRTARRASPRPSPSTRCASPGRPRPHGASQPGVLHRLARLPEREVERVLLARGALARPRPGPSARGRGATARRTPAASARGSRRRPRPRTRARARSASPISATISSTISVARGSWSGRPSPSRSVSAM